MVLKTKEAVKYTRYGRVYNLKYYQVLGCHNNWILIIFLDHETDEEIYEYISQTIPDGNVMNIHLIIMERKYVAIDAGDSSCHGYYIIKFSSSQYTLQADLSIYGKVVYSGKMVYEGTYFFPINICSHYYVSQKTKSINTIVYTRKIINGNINVTCYD